MLSAPCHLNNHLLQLISLNTRKYCKVLLDCSKFSSTSDLPVPWITEFFDVIPFDLLSQLIAVEILNPNRMAQGFLRKAKHLFMGMALRAPFAHLLTVLFVSGFSALNIDIDAMLSHSEKFEELHPGLTLPGEGLFGKYTSTFLSLHSLTGASQTLGLGRRPLLTKCLSLTSWTDRLILR